MLLLINKVNQGCSSAAADDCTYSNLAELHGLLLALDWICQHAIGAKVVIFCDNRSALHWVECKWNRRTLLAVTALLKLALPKCVETTQLTFVHVPSHTGLFPVHGSVLFIGLRKRRCTTDSPLAISTCCDDEIHTSLPTKLSSQTEN